MLSSTSNNESKYRESIRPFTENSILESDIKNIYTTSNLFNTIKRIRILHSRYNSNLSHSQIDYYIKKEKQKFKDIFKLFFQIIWFLLLFMCVFFLLKNSYGYYFSLEEDNYTKEQAVAYFNQEDFHAALLRFEHLYNNGHTDFDTMIYLYSTYSYLDDYDAMTYLLIDYLKTEYGLANLTINNLLCQKLNDTFRFNHNISIQTELDLLNFSNTVMSFSDVYSELYKEIQNKNYSAADKLCQTLAQAGANGFFFTSCYANVLINTNRVDEAYALVMEVVRDDVTKSRKMISEYQRYALVEYIKPYLDEKQQEDCENYITFELFHLDIVNDSDIIDSYIFYDEVEDIFKTDSNVLSLNLFNPLDKINIDYPCHLIDGKEFYLITVDHYDTYEYQQYQFLLDMLGNIFYYDGDTYIPLPTDNSNVILEKQSSTYINNKNPNISMVVNFEGSGEYSYLIHNTETNEIIVDTSHPSFSNYNIYSYIKNDNLEATFFLSDDKALFLVTKDPQNNFSHLEGHYILAK